MSEQQQATAEPIEIVAMPLPPADSGYVQAVNKLTEDVRRDTIETYDLPAHLVERPKVPAVAFAAIDPGKGDDRAAVGGIVSHDMVHRSLPLTGGGEWTVFNPRAGQNVLRVRPNPLYLSHGEPHAAWVILDEDNREVARGHAVIPLTSVAFATRTVTEKDWHCGRLTDVRRQSAHVEVQGPVAVQTRPPAPNGQ